MGAFYKYEKATRAEKLMSDEWAKECGIKNGEINLAWSRGRVARKRYFRKVFFTFLRMLIDDCIENNIVFVSPSKNWFKIYIKLMPSGAINSKILRKGVYEKVNIINSEGKIYQFGFMSKFLDRNKYRMIRIGWNKYNQLIDAVNGGKRYEGYRKKKVVGDYLDQLSEVFPLTKKESIRKIIAHYCTAIHDNVIKGNNVLLENKRHGVKFLIYKHSKCRK